MDFKAIEASAGTISLQTIDDLFREWQRNESDVEIVTDILRCLRAALALNARGEVRHHFTNEHGVVFCSLARGIFVQAQDGGEYEVVRGRCSLQVRVFSSAKWNCSRIWFSCAHCCGTGPRFDLSSHWKFQQNMIT